MGHLRAGRVSGGLAVVVKREVMLLYVVLQSGYSAACGPDVGQGHTEGGTGEASASGSGSDTGAETPMWTLGDGSLVAISSPVADAVGNLLVIAGTDAVLLADPPSTPQSQLAQFFDVSGVVLVSLTRDGEERWRRDIATDQVIGKASLWQPIVGPGDDVWTCWNGELRRWSAGGDLRWTTPGGCPSEYTALRGTDPAMTSDATYVSVDYVEVAVDAYAPEISAIGSDGSELWSMIVGSEHAGGGEDALLGTMVAGVSVATDGRIVVGCDTCVPGENGVASLDPASGELAMLFSDVLKQVPGPESYSTPIVAGMSTWFLVDRVEGAQTAVYHVTGAPPVDPALDVGMPLLGETTTFQLDFDANSLLRDGVPIGLVSPGELVGPVALVNPELVVAGYGSAASRVACLADCGLLLVDFDGNVAWQRDHVAAGLSVPVIANGSVVYVDDEQRVVSVPAPVDGLAGGAWPIVEGDARNTNAAPS